MIFKHTGFTLLLNILILGVIGSVIVLALQKHTIQDVQLHTIKKQGFESRLLAESCLEIAIDRLSENRLYAGNEEYAFDEGYCFIKDVTDDTLLTIGQVQSQIYRLNVQYSWQDGTIKIHQWHP